jgi:predicted small metal-binding protein
MAIKIGCHQLGIENCDWVAQGETDEDVVQDVVQHLEKEHHLKMPRVSVILSGRVRDKSDLGEDEYEDVVTIIQRLNEVLDIEPYEDSTHSTPIVSRFPNA